MKVRSRRLAAVLACSIVGVAASGAAGASSGQAVPAVVAEYNARDLGSPGLRRIHLSLHDGDSVSREFEVLHAWRRDGEGLRSLVVLEEPRNLRGTNYLLVEDEGLPAALEVYLHLPAGKGRVLSIRPGRFDEGLLGSDFAYSDLLWRIPLRGHRFEVVPGRHLDREDVVAVDVRAVTAEAREGTLWKRVRYYFQRDPALLLGADYHRAAGAGSTVAKRLRVEGWTRDPGAWTPTRMVMTVDERRRSVLRLGGVRFDLPEPDPSLFRPAALAELGKALRSDALPEFLSHLPLGDP